MLDSTQGVSVAMFVLTAISIALQTWLAVSAYRRRPVWASMQVLIVYAMGVIVYTMMISVAFLRGSYVWGDNDNLAAISSVVGTFMVIMIGRKYKLPWHDPIIKGCMSVPMRAVPNLIMAYTLWINGAGGVSMILVYISNLLTIMRVIQVVLTSIKVGEWDRNRIGLMISEAASGVSWFVVTIIWQIRS